MGVGTVITKVVGSLFDYLSKPDNWVVIPTSINRVLTGDAKQIADRAPGLAAEFAASKAPAYIAQKSRVIFVPAIDRATGRLNVDAFRHGLRSIQQDSGVVNTGRLVMPAQATRISGVLDDVGDGIREILALSEPMSPAALEQQGREQAARALRTKGLPAEHAPRPLLVGPIRDDEDAIRRLGPDPRLAVPRDGPPSREVALARLRTAAAAKAQAPAAAEQIPVIIETPRQPIEILRDPVPQGKPRRRGSLRSKQAPRDTPISSTPGPKIQKGVQAIKWLGLDKPRRLRLALRGVLLRRRLGLDEPTKELTPTIPTRESKTTTSQEIWARLQALDTELTSNPEQAMPNLGTALIGTPRLPQNPNETMERLVNGLAANVRRMWWTKKDIIYPDTATLRLGSFYPILEKAGSILGIDPPPVEDLIRRAGYRLTPSGTRIKLEPNDAETVRSWFGQRVQRIAQETSTGEKIKQFRAMLDDTTANIETREDPSLLQHLDFTGTPPDVRNLLHVAAKPISMGIKEADKQANAQIMIDGLAEVLAKRFVAKGRGPVAAILPFVDPDGKVRLASALLSHLPDGIDVLDPKAVLEGIRKSLRESESFSFLMSKGKLSKEKEVLSSTEMLQRRGNWMFVSFADKQPFAKAVAETRADVDLTVVKQITSQKPALIKGIRDFAANVYLTDTPIGRRIVATEDRGGMSRLLHSITQETAYVVQQVLNAYTEGKKIITLNDIYQIIQTPVGPINVTRREQLSTTQNAVLAGILPAQEQTRGVPIKEVLRRLTTFAQKFEPQKGTKKVLREVGDPTETYRQQLLRRSNNRNVSLNEWFDPTQPTISRTPSGWIDVPSDPEVSRAIAEQAAREASIPTSRITPERLDTLPTAGGLKKYIYPDVSKIIKAGPREAGRVFTTAVHGPLEKLLESIEERILALPRTPTGTIKRSPQLDALLKKRVSLQDQMEGAREPYADILANIEYLRSGGVRGREPNTPFSGLGLPEDPLIRRGTKALSGDLGSKQMGLRYLGSVMFRRQFLAALRAPQDISNITKLAQAYAAKAPDPLSAMSILEASRLRLRTLAANARGNDQLRKALAKAEDDLSQKMDEYVNAWLNSPEVRNTVEATKDFLAASTTPVPSKPSLTKRLRDLGPIEGGADDADRAIGEAAGQLPAGENYNPTTKRTIQKALRAARFMTGLPMDIVRLYPKLEDGTRRLFRGGTKFIDGIRQKTDDWIQGYADIMGTLTPEDRTRLIGIHEGALPRPANLNPAEIDALNQIETFSYNMARYNGVVTDVGKTAIRNIFGEPQSYLVNQIDRTSNIVNVTGLFPDGPRVPGQPIKWVEATLDVPFETINPSYRPGWYHHQFDGEWVVYNDALALNHPERSMAFFPTFDEAVYYTKTNTDWDVEARFNGKTPRSLLERAHGDPDKLRDLIRSEKITITPKVYIARDAEEFIPREFLVAINGAEGIKARDILRQIPGMPSTLKLEGDTLWQAMSGKGELAVKLRSGSFLSMRDANLINYAPDPNKSIPIYIRQMVTKVEGDKWRKWSAEQLEAMRRTVSRNEVSMYKRPLNYWKEWADFIEVTRPTLTEELVEDIVMAVGGPMSFTYRSWLSTANTVLATWKLSPPVSALVNLAQTLVTTFPKLGAKYTRVGFEKYTEYAMRKTPQLVDIARELGLHARLNQSAIDMLGLDDSMLKKASGYFLFLFNKADRVTTGNAGFGAYFKAIEEGGMTHTAAINYARDIIDRTMFRYGKENMPTIMRPPLMRTILQFKPFFINMLSFIGHLFSGNHQRIDSQARELFRFGLVMSTMGGLMAVPFMNKLDGALFKYFGFSPVNAVEDILGKDQTWTDKGHGWREAPIRGIFAALGWDISQRLFIGPDMENILEAALDPSKIAKAVSPWYDTLVEVGAATTQLAQRKDEASADRFINAVVPLNLAHAYLAMKQFTGLKYGIGGPQSSWIEKGKMHSLRKQVPVTGVIEDPLDFVFKGLGGRLVEESLSSDIRNKIEILQETSRNRRDIALSRIVAAIKAGDDPSALIERANERDQLGITQGDIDRRMKYVGLDMLERELARAPKRLRPEIERLVQRVDDDIQEPTKKRRKPGTSRRIKY